MRSSFIIVSLYLSVLLFASVAPPSWLPPIAIHPDQTDLLHAPAYGGLALLLIVTLRRHGVARGPAVLIAIGVTITCSFAIELSQAVVPTRNPSWADGATNALGILAAGATYFLISPFQLGRTSPTQAGDQ